MRRLFQLKHFKKFLEKGIHHSFVHIQFHDATGLCNVFKNRTCGYDVIMPLKTIPILTKSEWDELCKDLERGPTKVQQEYVRECVKTINNLKSIVKSWE